MERVWAMPNHKTFTIKPIKQLLEQEFDRCYYDLFPYPYDTDALERIKSLRDESLDKIAYDPPYSQRQLFEMYKGLGISLQSNAKYFKELDFEIDRVTQPGGKVIRFGWNSKRISKNFEINRILLVSHGAAHNDTICTVQIKSQTTLRRQSSDT